MVESQSEIDQPVHDHEAMALAEAENLEDAAAEGDFATGKELVADQKRVSASGERSSDDKGVDVEKGAVSADDEAGADANPDIVDWDGPDDPANPRNWSKQYKLIIVALISASVLYCNIATTMFAPGASIMEREFGFDNQTIEILTITIASLGFAIGLFIAPLSEVFGRIPIYRVATICYLGFTVGCSRSTCVAEFLVFRLLAGLSGSPFMTSGGGTIADLLKKEERGGAMAMFTLGPLIGPVCCLLSGTSK
jgi:hypothetical protein